MDDCTWTLYGVPEPSPVANVNTCEVHELEIFTVAVKLPVTLVSKMTVFKPELPKPEIVPLREPGTVRTVPHEAF